jgi:hypothetical protein
VKWYRLRRSPITGFAFGLDAGACVDTIFCYHSGMKRAHQRTLELVFARPTSANVRWSDIEALFVELGAHLEEREGSRVLVRLFGERRVFHRPHPEPVTDKGAVVSVRKWFEDHGVKP